MSEPNVVRSRRRILAAGLGGFLGALGALAGRPELAEASDGDTVKVGDAFTATSTTSLENTTTTPHVLSVASQSGQALHATSSEATAIFAHSNDGSAVEATSHAHGLTSAPLKGTATFDAPGVLGRSHDGYGLFGSSQEGAGAFGQGKSAGVVGAANTVGVLGYNGSASIPVAPLHRGVYGVTDWEGDSAGLHGHAATSSGVLGTTTWGSAVRGTAENGIGVQGESVAGIGMLGGSNTTTTPGVAGVASGRGTGVYGVSGNVDVGFLPGDVGVLGVADGDALASGVRGTSTTGGGVMGVSGASTPAPRPRTGVFGYADQDATARGVVGVTTTGQGVRGEATTGIGVRGYSASGTAASFESTAGVGLAVAGRIVLTRAGRASVAAGGTFVDVVVPGGLSASAVVHATIQGAVTTQSIATVRVNHPGPGQARIHLTGVASSSAATPVGWFVVG